MLMYFISFLVALGGALALTPVAKIIALRVGAVDIPEDRKVHSRETPTLGGLAIYASILLGIGTYLIITEHQLTSDMVGIFGGATIIVVFGAADDIHTLGPLVKLFGQILAAGVPVIMGVQIQNLKMPGFPLLSLSPELSVVISLVWIVAFMNIINLIDGLDGLAAGITCIAAFSLFYYASQTGAGKTYVDAALILIVLAGSTLGFLRYNFHPASIFMGDSGSMLLGFLLGTATIQGVLKSIAAVGLLLPIISFLIPIFDTALAIIRRGIRGKPITHADKEHIHHRLLEMGHSHRQAVLLLYFWTAICCGAGLTIKFAQTNKFIWIVLAFAFVGFGFTVFPRLVKRENRKGKHRTRKKKGEKKNGEANPQ